MPILPIGRENVSKLEGAVLEIVKNAYDADASVCCLYYANRENETGHIDELTGWEDALGSGDVTMTLSLE